MKPAEDISEAHTGYRKAFNSPRNLKWYLVEGHLDQRSRASLTSDSVILRLWFALEKWFAFLTNRKLFFYYKMISYDERFFTEVSISFAVLPYIK